MSKLVSGNDVKHLFDIRGDARFYQFRLIVVAWRTDRFDGVEYTQELHIHGDIVKD